MGSNSYIFSTLEKFSDGSSTDLSSFLAKFDRCCVVANKADAANNPVKGQLLMLFVEGRARAVLEEYELTQGGNPLTYTVLIAKLKEHFDSAHMKESSMLQFESRIKKVNESEEEYMLQLFKLYTAANPTHAEDVTLLAVKRKFMSGISPALRKNIFVFCSDPFAANVTRENLLSFGRQAKNLLSGTENDGGTTDLAGDRVLLATDQRATFDDPTTTNHDGVMAAINNLTLEVSGHVKETEKRFVDIQNTIATMYQRGNNGGGRGRGRGNRGRGRFNNRGGGSSGQGGRNTNNNNTNSNNNGGSQQRSRDVRCYKCNGWNHFAWACTSSSGNC